MFGVLVATLALAGECAPLEPGRPTLLVVTAADPGLLGHRAAVERTLRGAAKNLALIDATAAQRALDVEGGAQKRAEAFVDASSLIARAEERFRELETEESLAIIARATAKLASIHQHEGATKLLAHAHFLAAAIYLARDRTEAARQRMLRALDLDPEISPARDRYAPRALAELAAARSALGIREVGRLEVRVRSPRVEAEVHVDGRPVGKAPVVINALGTGRHLVRVSARGYKSWISTIAMEPRGEVELKATLQRDAELAKIDGIAAAIAVGEDVRSSLDLLAERAAADQVVFAVIGLAGRLSTSGTATVAVTLRTSRGGAAHAPSLARGPEALDAAAQCAEAAVVALRAAPPILGLANALASKPAPVPDPTPLWERHWFWAACAFTAIGVAGALVAARTAGGPPNEVEVTLVPRP